MIMETKEKLLGTVEAEVQLVLEESFEELEAKVAPGVKLNHNETLVEDTLEIEVEELEAKATPGGIPGVQLNHNETLVQDNA
jgi:hypothetical protein